MLTTLKRVLLFILILAPLSIGFSYFSLTAGSDDGNDHRKRHRDRHRERESEHVGTRLKAVTHSTYKETCGGCHFAYQPELLPFLSWESIVNRPDDHFGESLELDEQTKKSVLGYLQENAADHSTSKWAQKIMRSCRDQVPERITEIPYIREKHHDIPAATIKREAIGTLSNCTACHARAEEGIYEDDFVVVPK